MPQQPLRLVLYDDKERYRFPPLTYAWWAGARFYRAMGWIDHFYGASTWEEGLLWLVDIDKERPIGEIQYWGHGKWGSLFLAGRKLDSEALEPGSTLNPYLDAIKSRLSGPDALWWFRCCEAFGTREGHQFARAWSSFFNCRTAGHTHIIGLYQSGLHVLKPGSEPSWPEEEGVAEGTPDAPLRALRSRPGLPGTITCFHHQVPRDM